MQDGLTGPVRLMLAVFAVRAVWVGYHRLPFPTPGQLSKLLAFVTALTLFLPLRDRAGVSEFHHVPGKTEGPRGTLAGGLDPALRDLA